MTRKIVCMIDQWPVATVHCSLYFELIVSTFMIQNSLGRYFLKKVVLFLSVRKMRAEGILIKRKTDSELL